MPKMICIVCPRSCHLEIDENNQVTGHHCKRGIVYAMNEITSPVRSIASTVKIVAKEAKRLPVKTASPIPKDKIFLVMEEINKVVVKAPVALGEVIIRNVLGLGVNIVATRTIGE